MCWTVPGEPIDRAIETLLLETVKPSEFELCLAVEREVEGQTDGPMGSIGNGEHASSRRATQHATPSK